MRAGGVQRRRGGRRDARETGAPYPTDAALSKALTQAKRTPERAWLAEVSAVVLQQALADANTAYRNFFASIKGTRKGRKLGAPRFRSKRDRAQSIRFTRAARFKVTAAGRLRLPGIGDVPVRWSRELPGEASSVTVTVDATGRYHASFVVEVDNQPLPATDREAGTCPCGTTHDRDVNAARNILAAGRADRPTPAELASVSGPPEQSAVKQEPTGSAA